MVGDPTAGYALIEMIAALVVTLMLLALVLPNVSFGTSAVRLRALLVETADLLRDARTTAIVTGKPTSASFDGERRILQQGTRWIAMPADVGASLTASRSCPSSDTSAAVVFRPDGTNCGGVLRLARGDRRLRIAVGWSDGRIDVTEE